MKFSISRIIKIRPNAIAISLISNFKSTNYRNYKKRHFEVIVFVNNTYIPTPTNTYPKHKNKIQITMQSYVGHLMRSSHCSSL